MSEHMHVWGKLDDGSYVCIWRFCRKVRTEPIRRAWAA